MMQKATNTMQKVRKDRLSALDTETIGGYAVILSNEHRSWVADSFESCIIPLINDARKGYTSRRYMMWNQKYDSQAILKYLPDENLLELLDCNETLYNDRYKVTFIPGKLLLIRDLKLKAGFTGYDIAQFYNYMHLDDAAEQYLGERKLNNAITHEITSNAKYHTDNELFWIFATYRKEVMEYCKQDAVLTQKLAEYLDGTIKELFKFGIKRYTAKTVLGKEMIKRTVGKVSYGDGKTYMAYPRFMENSKAAKWARLAYHGGIFDCKMRGSFDEVTDIDISSAYPYHMRNLPNWSNGDFIEVLDHQIQKKDIYGWVWCRFDYPFIPYTLEEVYTWDELHTDKVQKVSTCNYRKYYPTGDRWQMITLREYRFLKKYGYLKDCLGGYVWRHNSSKPQYPDPFTWIDDIYKLKQEVKATEGKKSYKYSLTKMPMNSAYGTTAQKKGMAAFRNMFYASYITGDTRVQICEMLEEIGYDRYITIATDGILLEGNIDLPNRYTKGGLGSWDVDHWDKALVIANGIYELSQGDNVKSAMRGMLSFKGEMKPLVEKYKDQASFVPHTKDRPLTMYQGMVWHRYTRDDINRFVPIGRTLSCNAETSKKWTQIETFDSLLKNKYIGERFSIRELERF